MVSDSTVISDPVQQFEQAFTGSPGDDVDSSARYSHAIQCGSADL